MKKIATIALSVTISMLAACGGGSTETTTPVDNGGKPAGDTTNVTPPSGGASTPTTTSSAARWSKLSWSDAGFVMDSVITNIYMPSVSIDRSGDVVMVYDQTDVLNTKIHSLASVRNFNSGKWSTPVVISPSNEVVAQAGTGIGYGYVGANRGKTVIATDQKTGDAVVTIVTTASTQFPDRGSIWAVTYTKASQTWSSPTRLGYFVGTGPKVDTDENGHFIVGWTDKSQAPNTTYQKDLLTVVYDSNAKSWSAPVSLQAGGDVGSFLLRSTKQGSATARLVWERINASLTEVVVATSSPIALQSATWPTVQSMGTGQTPTLSDDVRHLAYQLSSKIAVSNATDNVFGTPQILSGDNFNHNPVIADNGNGIALLVFTSSYSTTGGLGDQYVSSLKSDGTWTAAKLATDWTFGGTGGVMSIDASGDALMSLQAGVPMSLRLNSSTGYWAVENKAYTGWGITMAADPQNHRAVLMWVDANRPKINVQMLK